MMIKKNRYKFTKDEFGVQSRIIDLVGSDNQILEVGCASGYLSQEFRVNNNYVVGVEIDRVAGLKAGKVCNRIIIGDIESDIVLNKIGRRKFDVIILADVLEHLKDPGIVLNRLTNNLKKSGRVIVSIPNIAFLTNRLLHLRGQFEYTEFGIMDKTHLKFFTRKSLTKLLNEAKLEITQIEYIGNFTQLPLYMKIIHPVFGKKNWLRRLESKVAKLWPEGLAVQFLIEAKLR